MLYGAAPELCPESGFYCPGYDADTVSGGSKPILIPTGQRTESVKKDAVKKELTLEMDASEYDETAVRKELAAAYGVPEELISLSMRAGSLLLTVTFVVAGGSSSNLVAALNAVSDATLSGVLGVPLTSSTPPVVTTINLVQEAVCPAGPDFDRIEPNEPQ